MTEKTKTKPKKQTKEKTAENEAAGGNELPKKIVRIEVLAQFVGVTVRRIQQLQQEGIIKPEPVENKKEGAKYDLLPCLHKIIFYYRDKADSRKSDDSDAMAEEKLKRITIKRETEELHLAEMKGELCKAEDIERVMGAVLTRLRINLLSIPKGVAPQIREMKDVDIIAEKIHERICRALNEVVSLDLDALMAKEEQQVAKILAPNAPQPAQGNY
jgi:phage terminase Nu1 subunit (DNA packaging protein)